MNNKILGFVIFGMFYLQACTGKDGEFEPSNRTGKFSISPQFERAEPFSEGLAAVKINGMWGYSDKSGKIKISPKFSSAKSFVNGLAAVAVGNERVDPEIDDDQIWGYIKTNGDYAIQPSYVYARSFSKERRIAAVGNKDVGFFAIDEDGTTVIKPNIFQELAIPDDKDGLIVALSEVSGKTIMGFIDDQGNWKVSGNYVAAPFSEGLAPLCVDVNLADANERCGYVNRDGNFVILPRFDRYLSSFKKARALVKEGPAEKIGIIDNAGNYILKPTYVNAVPNKDWLSEGLIAVQLRSLWGYADKDGKIVIESKYSEANSFSEGLGAVWVQVDGDSKCGYVDRVGKMVIVPKFKICGDFREGLAPVSVMDGGEIKWGYIYRN